MYRKLILVAMLGAACSTLFAAAPPLQFANLGDLQLENGEVIRDCRLGYRTYGTLNSSKSNAVLFPTWFSGRSEDLDSQVRAWFDPSLHFVITVDALGNGVSSSPSNSKLHPRLAFPKFTVRDMVRSQYRLATEVFGLKRLHAVTGISMGGMQAFEWVVAYPGFVERAVPVVGSPRLASSDILLWTAEARAIEKDRDFNGGAYQTPPVLEAVAAIHQFALTSPGNLARETAPAATAAKLKQATADVGKMDACDWLRQLQAMLAHDVSVGHSLQEAAQRVQARMLVVIASQDHMVNPIPAREFARSASIPVLELNGDCGHLAPGCESATVAAAISSFVR